MKALVLFCIVALVQDGVRCLGYVQNRFGLSNIVNKRSREEESLMQSVDETTFIVNDFLKKIKRDAHVDNSPKADKCGYEVNLRIKIM